MAHQRSDAGLLFRHFFRRLFENDLLAPGEDIHRVLAGVAGAIIVIGGFSAFLLAIKYNPTVPMPLGEKLGLALDDRAMLVGVAMAVMALATVVAWDALLLDHRDYAILGHLPVEARTLIAAKLAALSAFVALFGAAVSVIPSVSFPLVVLATEDVPAAFGFRMMGAQLAATLGGCLFSFLAIVGLRGLVGLLVGDRASRSVLPVLQFVLVLVLLMLLLLSPWLASQVRAAIEGGSRGLLWWPAMWFVGMNEWLLGRATPISRSLTAAGGAALAASALIAALTYALACLRATQALCETAGASVPGGRLDARLIHLAGLLLARHPSTRASFVFTASTLARSARHRLYVAGYIGGGLALVVVSVTLVAREVGWSGLATPRPALLAAQTQLLLFALIGARVAASLPAELRSNWVFQLLAQPDLGRYLAGARRAVLVQVALPLLLALAPVHVLLWGAAVAAWHFAVGLAEALVLVGVLFAGFPKIPFTCPYVPGKADLKWRLPFYFVAYWLVVHPPSVLEHHALRHPEAFVAIASALAAMLAGLATHRWWRLRRQPEPRFFDEMEPSVQRLGLID